MKTTVSAAEAVKHVLTSSTRSVVELVDDLLALCHSGRVHFQFESGRCFVARDCDSKSEEFNVPLSKSQFRAVLARIAVLCNEASSTSVSPYGGQEIIRLADNQRRAVRVTFANTPDSQSLDIRPVRNDTLSTKKRANSPAETAQL